MLPTRKLVSDRCPPNGATFLSIEPDSGSIEMLQREGDIIRPSEAGWASEELDSMLRPISSSQVESGPPGLLDEILEYGGATNDEVGLHPSMR